MFSNTWFFLLRIIHVRIISNVSKGRGVLSFLFRSNGFVWVFSGFSKSEDPMRFHLKAGLSTLGKRFASIGGKISRQTNNWGWCFTFRCMLCIYIYINTQFFMCIEAIDSRGFTDCLHFFGQKQWVFCLLEETWISQDRYHGYLDLSGGGFKYFICSPRSIGKWSNLTCGYFSNGLVQLPNRKHTTKSHQEKRC